LVNGKINLKEYIIAKEYRGRDTYNNVKSIAACQVANKALVKDPLAEPLVGERVPYVRLTLFIANVFLSELLFDKQKKFFHQNKF
jgi:hypothetical protein